MGLEKHLLIDGANVVHAWPDLRALFKRDREAARGQLVARIMAIHDNEAVRITVVFDGRGDRLQVECPGGAPALAVIHTPSGTTADDVIEQLVARAAHPSTCTVVTADRAERETIEASGASWCSPEALAAWVQRAREGQATQVAGLQRDAQRQWRRR